MRKGISGFVVCAVVLFLALAGTAAAQSTSQLTGRVLYQEEGMPGVTVTLTSSALQGQQVTVTNSSGDYIFKGLPAGDYNVRFDLATFAPLEYDVRISTSQPRTLDAVIYPESIQGEIVVTSSYETVSTGAQGSETMEQSMVEKLPIQRTMQQAVLLSAGTSNTGPDASDAVPTITIAGAQSYESLFTMNGVVLNENLRGQPLDMFIEDAILETTTITSNASAEYGRFAGGVVNMVTKSGGNEFSGSLRVNVTNESWNGETPLTTDQQDKNNYVYEATLGGYILRDHLWFFAAGRDQDITTSGQLFDPAGGGEQFPRSRTNTRLEGKLTGSFGPNHRVAFNYMDIDTTDTNYVFRSLPSADWASVDPERSLPNKGWNVSYTGVLSDNFFLEGLYSQRELMWEGSGGDDTSIGGGTVVIDYLEYVLFNAPLFCGVCPPEERSNENYWGKASWFLSGAGTHDLVFGFDVFNDIRKADNWQSASGYLLGTWTPQDYSENGNPYLVLVPDDYIIWGAVPETSQGNSFETKSAYVNDTWRINDRLTINLGLRYDKADGTDQGGAKVVDDSRISPRLSATYDVGGDGKLVVSGGFSRYVMSTGQIADVGAAAGNPVYNIYLYGGPSIYAGTDEYPTNPDAIEAVFDWFNNVYGGVGNTDNLVYAYVPGLTPKVGPNLDSPYGDEYTIGASYRLGTRGVVRADYVHRKYGDFYASSIVPNRWVSDEATGVVLDLAEYVNYDAGLSRKYDAVMARFDYRIGSRWNFGANYTWSEVKGNTDGETGGGGPAANTVLTYQEYKDPSWNTPVGYLLTDQTHKFRAWVQWDAISTAHHNLNISLLQNFYSGTPYSALQTVNTIPYVGDPEDLGYIGSSLGPVNYYFSDRGAYRTENVTSTDIAINYSFFLNLGGTQLEAFVQPEVTNVFNESAATTVNTTIYGPRQGMEDFNPFTETPVEGVNWEKGPSFGEPQSAADYQRPRTVRVSFGLRF